MGDVIVVEDEKKGRNREVLGDIGNVVRRNYSKNEQAKINRPRTRSQQVSIVEENPKNKNVIKRIAVPKPKKAAGKSKGIEVIEISSDSDEEEARTKEKKITKKKKRATSYTSVLTTRSKAACGLAKKPKDLVDIDEVDVKNDLLLLMV